MAQFGKGTVGIAQEAQSIGNPGGGIFDVTDLLHDAYEFCKSKVNSGGASKAPPATSLPSTTPSENTGAYPRWEDDGRGRSCYRLSPSSGCQGQIIVHPAQ